MDRKDLHLIYYIQQAAYYSAACYTKGKERYIVYLALSYRKNITIKDSIIINIINELRINSQTQVPQTRAPQTRAPFVLFFRFVRVPYFRYLSLDLHSHNFGL